jgi:hypothetical protein
MEDERRKFLQGLLALGGGAAMLPEALEAMQSKLTRPLSAKILKRESTKNDPFVDSLIEVELTDANGTKETITVSGTEYADTSIRRTWATLSGSNTAVTAIAATSKKVDSGHEEITVTITANGKTTTTTRTMASPANRITGEGLSDDELIEKILAPKLGGVK